MENLQCYVTITLQNPENQRGWRISARQAKRKSGATQCQCCSNHQVLSSQPKHHQAAPTDNCPRKREQSSEVHPFKPSSGQSEELNLEPAPQSSTPTLTVPGLFSLVPRPSSTISPAVVSYVAPCSRASTAPLQDDSPLTIHNRSVEKYQQIYQELADDMLTYKSGRPRLYSLELGLRIKQKLWERLNCPLITTSFSEDGRVDVNVSYGVGVYAPLYDVDFS